MGATPTPHTYHNPVYPYRRPADLDAAAPRRYPVVVVGAGPCGMAMALDLASRAVPVLLLDDNDTVSVGSRAICFSKRALEIFDRLGCGQCMVDKGVTWHVGKVFFHDREVYRFDLLPEPGHARPAFINLQQYYVEQYLVEQLDRTAGVETRWKNKVVGIEAGAAGAALTVHTADGDYRLEADYVIAADGANSALRRLLDLPVHGQTFPEHFLIADVVMKAAFPTERWFWFEPPFHNGQSTLLHKQPDNVWRIDFGLGFDADPQVEKQPDKVIPRVKAMLGNDVEFELEWCSVYTFRCQRMEQFVHGRVIFIGDAAHLVSPFGARGANSGIQDADNLAWKLATELAGEAGPGLLASYDHERVPAADENITHSTRSTDFIAPKNNASRLFRDAVLLLSRRYPFARALVNSGRLSRPAVYGDSPLNSADGRDFGTAMRPGSPCIDAPVRIGGVDGWWLHQLAGRFTVALFGALATRAVGAAVAALELPLDIITVNGAAHRAARPVTDVAGLLAERYDVRDRALYLIRPDQHVAYRARVFDHEQLRAAYRRAMGF